MVLKMCKILLSIRPEHARNIMNGVKKYEFRRTDCRRDVSHIIIYSTYPIMKVIGEASVKRKLVCSPEVMWKRTHAGAGVSREFFDEYYEGCEKAIAFELGSIKEFDHPRSLEEYGVRRAPQSFTYMTN